MAIYGQDVGKTDEWCTPPQVFAALNVEFNTDVASPAQGTSLMAAGWMGCAALENAARAGLGVLKS